jgi:trimeric autotransporter adhesin
VETLRPPFSKVVATIAAILFFMVAHAQAPANDNCAGAVLLTPGAGCTGVTGTVNRSTLTGGVPANCGTAATFDVWYTFVATTTNPTIQLSGLGTSFTAPNIQLLSGTCLGMTSVACSNNNILATSGLSVGTSYFVRVFGNSGTAPNSQGGFTICVNTVPSPANDFCANAVTLTSGFTCTTTTGTIAGATFTNGTTVGCAGGTVLWDVWYSFVAQSANPTITLSNPGSNFPTANANIQVYSGTCGAFTSLSCGAYPSLTALGLTVGTTYLVRVYSTVSAPPTTNGNFDICITDPTPPANDLCANAISLTSGATCTNVTGTIANATFTTGTTAACAGTAKYDVWFTFQAKTTNPTITLSTVGANFNAQTPRLQVFSGTCGALTSVGCGTSTYTPTGLTVGATYYLRVYSTTTSAVPNTLGNFDLCITDPPPPGNDDCANATLLTAGATCVNTAGTLNNSTSTAGIPNDCGASGSPEVWYKFVAVNPFPQITLSGVGANLTAAGVRIQLLSGTCGAFTSIGCVSGNIFFSGVYPGGAGLTPGATYYVRIYTNTAGQSGAGWGFNICVSDGSLTPPTLDYGFSYINVTKGTNGGTVEPGDELEIRTTFVIKSGSVYNPSFSDIVPANTAYKPGSLQILTNEGQVYKQYTDAADGDPATITGSSITINLGNSATSAGGSMIRNTDRPTLFGGTYMAIASYHVTVTGGYGSTITFNNSKIQYYNPVAALSTITFPTYTAIVYKNYGICTNTVGSNSLLSESGGTFGSGNLKDRGTASSKVPSNYTLTPITSGGPSDYFYAISNNTSSSTAAAGYSTNFNDPVLAHHVFNVWDIIGDHTGASDPLAGNPAADVNAGATGGYMVVINAAFRTDTAFLDTVKNLCPSTSYEYSAWFRNICRKCSGDSTGKGPSTVGYVPTAPGDSSGVHPNMTFNINGNDYYTTGDMPYTGQWVKKGFTYRTGPSETQMVINIRNNAPGGGGNDWAIDDIGVATCSPTLDVTPAAPNMNLCYGDGGVLSATVRSFFDNYTYWIWEKSVDSGVTWVSAGGAYQGNGTITPTQVGSEYIYTANGPAVIGDSTTHGNIYRLRVATSSGNIVDSSCSFVALRTVKVYVNNCSYLLKINFLKFNGVAQNGHGQLHWETTSEDPNTTFEVERSDDGDHFSRIGTVKSNAIAGSGTYNFRDPLNLSSATYYRIKAKALTGFTYTKTILLSMTGDVAFDVRNVVSPFGSTLTFRVSAPTPGEANVVLTDMYGRMIRSFRQPVSQGETKMSIDNLGSLSGGIYSLQVSFQGKTIVKRVIK